MLLGLSWPSEQELGLDLHALGAEALELRRTRPIVCISSHSRMFIVKAFLSAVFLFADLLVGAVLRLAFRRHRSLAASPSKYPAHRLQLMLVRLLAGQTLLFTVLVILPCQLVLFQLLFASRASPDVSVLVLMVVSLHPPAFSALILVVMKPYRRYIAKFAPFAYCLKHPRKRVGRTLAVTAQSTINE